MMHVRLLIAMMLATGLLVGAGVAASPAGAADADGDGVEDGADNCPGVPNPGQENSDENFIDNPAPLPDDATRITADTLGDACDPDDDNDALSDVNEAAAPNPGCPAASAAPSSVLSDTDGDRFLDSAECLLGADPSSSASKPAIAACGVTSDADGDGLQDRTEVCFYASNASASNTDGDICSDGREIASLNADAVVNAGDQLILAQTLMPSPYLANADMNKDGVTNAGDQLFIALRYGSCGLEATSPVSFVDVTNGWGLQVGDATWGTYGANWGDYDGDGDPDVLLSRHAIAPRLLRNDGIAGFLDTTPGSGLEVNHTPEDEYLFDRHGCGWGDYDGDDDLDLYCNAGAHGAYLGQDEEPNELFRNDGDGTFTELGAALGVGDPPGRGRGMHWVDYDGDGAIDIFSPNMRRAGSPNHLFRGVTGAFTDESSTAGVADEVDILGAGSAWADYDGDHDTDLFVADFAGIIVHRNNSDGTFAANDALQAGLTATLPRSLTFTDADNDGDLDLFVARIALPAIAYRNNGDGTFTDVTEATGLGVTRAAAAVFADFDNDADIDAFIVREYAPGQNQNLPDMLLLNNGAGIFTEAGEAAGISGPYLGAGDSAALSDFDRDGRIDLLVAHGALQVDVPGGPQYSPMYASQFPPGAVVQYARAFPPVVLFRNTTSTAGNWIEVRLQGAGPNAQALGAKVWLTVGGEQQYREAGDAIVQYGQSDAVLHFGVGAATTIDELRIRWPDGSVQTMNGLPANQLLEVVQP
jgi:hypothetical protein